MERGVRAGEREGESGGLSNDIKTAEEVKCEEQAV